MKPFKIFFAIILVCFMFVGCKEKEPTYDTVIFSHDEITVYNKFSDKDSDTQKYILLDEGQLFTEIDNDILSHSDSITIFSHNIDDESARWLTNYCKKKNIPVFFLNSDIDDDIINGYDKAFNIKTDYVYAGEVFARHVKEIWEDTLVDNNGDRIFCFAVITPEEIPDDYQTFYDSFLKYIELLGIPLEQKDMIFLSRGDVLEYCHENQGDCEAFIILSQEYLSLLYLEYEPYGEGVEILGMSVGNKIANDFMHVCFIDYNEFFAAKDIILQNIKNKVYPFTDFNYSFIDKDIYIEPVV